MTPEFSEFLTKLAETSETAKKLIQEKYPNLFPKDTLAIPKGIYKAGLGDDNLRQFSKTAFEFPQAIQILCDSSLNEEHKFRALIISRRYKVVTMPTKEGATIIEFHHAD
jgi:hypothetical protein